MTLGHPAHPWHPQFVQSNFVKMSLQDWDVPPLGAWDPERHEGAGRPPRDERDPPLDGGAPPLDGA